MRLGSRRTIRALAVLGVLALSGLGCTGSGAAGKPPAKDAKSEHSGQADIDAHANDQGSGEGPLTNARVEARLRKTVGELPPRSGVQRIALADIAYPANAEENRKLAGFTLFVVTAVTHDASELPPRVVFRHSRGELAVPALFSHTGSLDPADLRAVFGAYRYDALYVIPLQATQVDGVVLAKFQNGTRDFQLLAFPANDLPAGVEPADPGEPDMDAVRVFAEREFPIVEERKMAAPND
jgi:hypothetical protein